MEEFNLIWGCWRVAIEGTGSNPAIPISRRKVRMTPIIRQGTMVSNKERPDVGSNPTVSFR